MVLSFRRRPIAMGALLLSALSACQSPPTGGTQNVDSTAGETVALSPLPLDREAKLSAFLHEHYGEEARIDGEWRQEYKETDEHASDGFADAPGRDIARSVCAQYWEEADGHSRLWLAICGNISHAGHPEPGLIDFYLLQEQPERLEIVSHSLNQPFGSYGNAGQVDSIVKVGAGTSAFLIKDGWAGQGFLLQSQTLLAPIGKTFLHLASLRDSINNGGWYDCEEDPSEECRSHFFNLDFTLKFDGRDGAAAFYPLVVTERGVECGKTVQREYRLDYDATQSAYPVPEALMREDCLVEDSPNRGNPSP
ncbi:MAG: hypothetical protein LBV45_04315 [Xanthomonadaceae bacterium]|nr:hypothetical protein [Xanthomonadaceae bacterium]